MNKIFLKGRLTKDPDLRVTKSGIEVLRFCLAVPRKYDRDIVDFINCTAWRKTASFIATYFTKGQEMIVDGELQQQSWEDKDGNSRSSFDVCVGEVDFCGSKGDSNGNRNVGFQEDELPFGSDDEDSPF